jgi:hypothetical protein
MLTFSNLMLDLIRDVNQKTINPGTMLWLSRTVLVLIKMSPKHLIPVYMIQTTSFHLSK